MLYRYRILNKMGEREYLVKQASTIGFKFPEFFDPEKHVVNQNNEK